MIRRFVQFARMFVLIISISSQLFANDIQLLETLMQIKAAHAYLPQLYALADKTRQPDDKAIPERTDALPLYTEFPTLKNSLPSVQLTDLPTPVQNAPQASNVLGVNLYIKRDDLTNAEFGGNKKRKLEFLLGDAKRKGAQSIVTQGAAGSNHVAASLHAAEQVGFVNNYAALKPQTNSHGVRKNLLLMHQFGGIIHLFNSNEDRDQGIIQLFFKHKQEHGNFPYFIPTGGSCPMGVVGYVNAIFELKEQIKQGLLPVPDYIYVSSGSKGTVAGLLLGLKAAGITSKLVPVCVEPEDNATYADEICALSKKTNELLHNADPNFPVYDVQPADMTIIYDCCGTDYGVFSPEGMAAKKLLQETDNVILDGTYTAKGFSGLIRDAQNGTLQGKNVLFWNTYCAHAKVKNNDHSKLPVAVHKFFKQDVQSLDK